MYNKFSDFYDILVFDIDYKKYANNIYKILNDNKIYSGSILEIGAGTGNLTKKLAENQNFSIQAFDYSDQMLNHAFNKLADYDNVQVFKFDMYKFPYQDYEYDAIVSLLDVINYIRDEDKLKQLFSSIYKGLKQGGVFAFDLNSKYKLLDVLGNNTYVYEHKNIFYTWENTLEDDFVYFDLNFFVKENGNYSRIRENQIEKYYPLDYIIDLLKQVGFKQVSHKDEDGGPYIEDKTQRILIWAIK